MNKKCHKCGGKIQQSYIRSGQQGELVKIGFFCKVCGIYYDGTGKKIGEEKKYIQ